MNNLRFKDRLDSELGQIEFTAQSRQKVLERVKSLQTEVGNQVQEELLERVHAFLNREVRIPVRSLAVVLLITLLGLVYGAIGVAGVSAEELQRSSITVMDGSNGGQANELYKN
jgi:hypothetical protein